MDCASSGLSRAFPESRGPLLERAVAASACGIVVTDPNQPDDPIVYVNPAFEEITGYSAGEVLGRNCRFLQGSDRNQPALPELRAALGEGRECRIVLRNYRKDGEPFYNELYVSPVRDEEGRLVNFVGVQNDVTARKRAAEEREHLLARERSARREAVAARRRLALLAAAGPALSASPEYTQTLETIPDLFVPDLADWCLLDVAEEHGGLRHAAAAAADSDKARLLENLRTSRDPDGDPHPVREVLISGRSILIPETGEAAPDAVADLRALEPRSCVRVPLLAWGRALGVLTLVFSERRYDPEDLALAESLAHRCALALDGALLYRDQGYVTRTLQQGLQPHLPQLEEIEVGARYRPVGEETGVGGDFYDLLPAPGEGNGWIPIIGDVRGKGVPAAAATALALYTMRAIALREAEPVGILSALNEALLREASEGRFCTAACLHLEPDECGAELTLARGGHPPPFLLRSDGATEKLDSRGRALGIFEDPDLGERKERLQAGDAVVLYTDGVTEARSPGGTFFGEENLAALLRSCANLEAPAVAECILDAVLEHAAGEPRDDLAILVLRFRGRS